MLTGKQLHRVFLAVLAVYLIASAPLIIGYLKSQAVRVAYRQSLLRLKSKAIKPHIVFVGDSITDAGLDWRQRLAFGLLTTDSLAWPGQTLAQINLQVTQALRLRPAYVVILAGTNDVLAQDFSEADALLEFERILRQFSGQAARPIVTLVPYQQIPRTAGRIQRLNAGIRDLARRYGIRTIDLNNRLAPDGVLLDRYTSDGIHLTPAAYQIWFDTLKRSIEDAG